MSTQCDDLVANDDISGVGIRVGFYVQILCLYTSSIITYYNPTASRDDAEALVLPITTFSYALVVVIWGLLPRPELTLFDAIVACALFFFMFISFVGHQDTRPPSRTKLVAEVIIRFSYTFASLVVAHRMPNFGKSPECFHDFFILFNARCPGKTLKILMLVLGYLQLIVVCVMAYSLRSIFSNKGIYGHSHGSSAPPIRRRNDFYFSYLIAAVFITIFLIINIEYTTSRNRTLYGLPAPRWTLAQVLAVLLTLPSIAGLVIGIFAQRHEYSGKKKKEKKKVYVNKAIGTDNA
ncbi:hypothetical protein AX16_007733 [Volvariella volvacea WC 439]|nr:hypothetical protein AX16_007733 [Volvariella volvacea WC 439]